MNPIFQWVLISLFAFRVTRFVTTDDLTHPFRSHVERRFGSNSNWFTLVTCNWCVGFYIVTAIYAIAAQLINIPSPVLQAGATMAVVGYLGVFDE